MKKLIIISLGLFLLSFSFFGCSEENLVMIPDLRGMEVTKAKSKIEELGLILVSEKGSYSTSVEANYILAQVPYPFTEVKKGRSVSVKISKGPPVVFCPALVGKKYGEASQILKDLNLHVSSLVEVNDYKELERQFVKE
ncbi:MAG: PASTA domain-containing protein, partial [Caldisericia bacterium]|nr:PASTA domain-containing protein [Caldisericia bacterium]